MTRNKIVRQSEWDRVLHDENRILEQLWSQTGSEGGRPARTAVWAGIFEVNRVKDEALEATIQIRGQAKEDNDDPLPLPR